MSKVLGVLIVFACFSFLIYNVYAFIRDIRKGKQAKKGGKADEEKQASDKK